MNATIRVAGMHERKKICNWQWREPTGRRFSTLLDDNYDNREIWILSYEGAKYRFLTLWDYLYESRK